MKNKILIHLFVPQIDEEFDIYIPLNKNIANTIILIGKSIKEIKYINDFDTTHFSLYSCETGMPYKPDSIIKESNIRNSTNLILM